MAERRTEEVVEEHPAEDVVVEHSSEEVAVEHPADEVGVERREETVTRREPGYAATEHVTEDYAAEQRMRNYRAARVIWTVLGILEILLGLRFLLRLIATNPSNAFATFIYGITGPFVAPFRGLVGTPAVGGTVFEWTTLIAMAVYWLFFWIVVRVIQVVADRPSARTVSRSVHERTDDRL